MAEDTARDSSLQSYASMHEMTQIRCLDGWHHKSACQIKQTSKLVPTMLLYWSCLSGENFSKLSRPKRLEAHTKGVRLLRPDSPESGLLFQIKVIEIVFPILEHLFPLFVLIAQMQSFFAQMGSLFAQNSTPSRCSLLYSCSLLSGYVRTWNAPAPTVTRWRRAGWELMFTHHCPQLRRLQQT